MTTQPVTLHLPESLYQRLQQRAATTQRSVEAEALDTLVSAVPVADELPVDLAAAISPLKLLSDDELWHAARTTFSARAAAQLEALHDKRQRGGWTESEAQQATTLVRQYERTMLVRAQATALLKQRGYDVTPLLHAA